LVQCTNPMRCLFLQMKKQNQFQVWGV